MHKTAKIDIQEAAIRVLFCFFFLFKINKKIMEIIDNDNIYLIGLFPYD